MKKSFSFSSALLLLGAVFLYADAPKLANIFSPSDTVQAVKLTSKGKPNVLSQSGDFGGGGDDEQAPSVVDGDPNTKYFTHVQDGSNDPGVNTGFVDVPKSGATVVSQIQLITGNDSPDRDPISITLEGSNATDAATAGSKDWELIYEGTGGLDSDPGRNTNGTLVSFPNTKPYTAYRMLVTKTRNSTDGTQYSEVMLMGVKQ